MPSFHISLFEFRVSGSLLSVIRKTEKLLPQILRMAEQRLRDRQSFVFSAASSYYYYLIFLLNCVISKEVHSPPRLIIINKNHSKTREKKKALSPKSLEGRRKSNNTGQGCGPRCVQEVLNRLCGNVVRFPGAFRESKGRAIWMVTGLACFVGV